MAEQGGRNDITLLNKVWLITVKTVSSRELFSVCQNHWGESNRGCFLHRVSMFRLRLEQGLAIPLSLSWGSLCQSHGAESLVFGMVLLLSNNTFSLGTSLTTYNCLHYTFVNCHCTIRKGHIKIRTRETGYWHVSFNEKGSSKNDRILIGIAWSPEYQMIHITQAIWFIYCTYKQEKFTCENLKLENTNVCGTNCKTVIERSMQYLFLGEIIQIIKE